MARRKISASTSAITIGNCEVIIEGTAKTLKAKSGEANSLQISTTKATKIKISVVGDAGVNVCKDVNLKSGENDDGGAGSYTDCQFSVINPKDADSSTKLLLEKVLSIYKEELPAMKYAANTGKESMFLEKCVLNGKFSTLILRSNFVEYPSEILAAVTYQIIPADTQYAEIPLAAVRSTYQRKGIGRVLYSELRKRLLSVGIATILCWGDKKSEEFWQKQGFISVAEVSTKGRARKLPIRSDVRRALCFPGGSTFMISHLDKHSQDGPANSIKLSVLPKPHESSDTLVEVNQGTDLNKEGDKPSLSVDPVPETVEDSQKELNCVPEAESTLLKNYQDLAAYEIYNVNPETDLGTAIAVAAKVCSTYERNTKRTVWQASSSSFKSKRIKASHDYQSCSGSGFEPETEMKDHLSDNCSLREKFPLQDETTVCGVSRHGQECMPDSLVSGGMIPKNTQPVDKRFNIMLMDLAEGDKKAHLTQIIQDLGGAVTSEGSSSTHILTGKARKTLNFCTSLCSGAWILTPSWLKTSFRKGRFVDERPFILKDEDYLKKFSCDLEGAVLRARKNPRGLLKGYYVCLTAHVQPPFQTMSAIVKSAGGNVVRRLDEICDKSRTIVVACEEDMVEALLAARRGIRTYSSDWLMSCIMKQELDMEAPQFAASL